MLWRNAHGERGRCAIQNSLVDIETELPLRARGGALSSFSVIRFCFVSAY